MSKPAQTKTVKKPAAKKKPVAKKSPVAKSKKDGKGLLKNPKMPRDKRPADYAGVGAPSKYKPEYCALVIELGKQGKSLVQIAVALDVTRETVYQWADSITEFSDALTRARQCSQDWWEKQAQNNLLIPQGGGTFQATVWAKSMSARFPDDYTDKTKTEHTGKLEISRIERVIIDPAK